MTQEMTEHKLDLKTTVKAARFHSWWQQEFRIGQTYKTKLISDVKNRDARVSTPSLLGLLAAPLFHSCPLQSVSLSYPYWSEQAPAILPAPLPPKQIRSLPQPSSAISLHPSARWHKSSSHLLSASRITLTCHILTSHAHPHSFLHSFVYEVGQF